MTYSTAGLSKLQAAMKIRQLQHTKAKLTKTLDGFQNDPRYVAHAPKTIIHTEQTVARISANILTLSAYLHELTNSGLSYSNESECYEHHMQMLHV